jgi:dTDP-4-dehydrorhamnose reductase
MTTVLVTGGSGLLGQALRLLDPAIVAPTRADMDICDRTRVHAVFVKHSPRLVIHAAAMVGAGACDKDPERCLEVNVGGTLAVAVAARACGARLVYVSTDYVFDGTAAPYRETDPVAPLNRYARTKVAGEMIALGIPGALVVRTSFCASRGWKFPSALVDQYSSRDIVDRIAPEVLEAAHSALAGVLHIGGRRRSVFDLARSLEPNVRPLTIAETGLALPRDVTLDHAVWDAYRAARAGGHDD